MIQVYSLEQMLLHIVKSEERAAERASTIHRPTEDAVIMSLDDGKALAWEYTIPRERLVFSIDYFRRRVADRHCEKCNHLRPLKDFARVKYTWDGWAFWCKRCQGEYDKLTWVNAAEWRKVA